MTVDTDVGGDRELCARFSIVLDATADLNDMLSDPDKLYASLLGRLSQAVPFTTGSLQVMDGDSSRIVAFRGDLDPEVVMGLRFGMDPLFPNYRVVMTKSLVSFADIRTEYPHFETRQDEFASGKIRSWLGVPMVAAGQVIGMFALDRNVVDPFSVDDARIAQAFANHAAVAIRNARTMSELRAAVAAKSTLLRELHHRVKNNLQLVSSLIEMHTGHIQEPDARNGLDELQVRIRSIASIHERLYLREGEGEVQLDDYLRDLAMDTIGSMSNVGVRAELELSLAKTKAGIDVAVPLGLIASELVINALKYAFPGGRGTIRIVLRPGDDGLAELEVSDDGVGMESPARGSGGFGLVLVPGLAQQIGGRASVESRPGRTAWTVSFSGAAPATRDSA